MAPNYASNHVFVTALIHCLNKKSGKPALLKNVLDKVQKNTNFVKSSSLSSHRFGCLSQREAHTALRIPSAWVSQEKARMHLLN